MSTLFICYFSPCSGSHTDEPEDLTFLRTPLLNEQDQKTFDAQLRQSSPKPPSLDDLDVTPEKEGQTTIHLIVIVDSIQISITQNINYCVLIFVGKSSANEGLEESSSASKGNISENICSPENVNIQDAHSSYVLLLLSKYTNTVFLYFLEFKTCRPGLLRKRWWHIQLLLSVSFELKRIMLCNRKMKVNYSYG